MLNKIIKTVDLLSLSKKDIQEWLSKLDTVLCDCDDVKLLAQKLTSTNSIYGQFADLTRLDKNLGTNLKHHFLKHQRPMVGVFIDFNCPNSEVVLNGSSIYRLYNDHYHWLIYDQTGNIQNFRLKFENVNVTVNSDVTYVIPTFDDMMFRNISSSFGESEKFLQFDVYNNGPHIGGKLNMTEDRSVICSISKCLVEKYVTDLYKRSKYGNRNRQSDINLRISTVITTRPLTLPEDENIKFLLSDEGSNIDSISCFGYQQVTILREMLQCSFKHVWRSAWSFNDTHGGLIGDLINEDADLLSSTMIISLYRRRFVVPIVQSAIFHSICMFRTPRKTGLLSTGEVYLDPFSRTVWLAFGAVIIIAALQLWGIFVIENYGIKRQKKSVLRSGKEKPSFITSLLISFGTVCAQGTHLLPSTTGGRIAYSALVLASFIMYNYYTSIIVSTLLNAPVKSNIKTLAQLADSSLEVAFEATPLNYAFLNGTTAPAVRRLIKRKVEARKNPYTAYMPAAEGIELVRDRPGSFAYAFEATTGYALVEKLYEPNEICDLNEILLRPEQNLNNLVHKNSSFVELFRLRLLRMIETGVNRRNVRHWLRNRLYCFPSTEIIKVGLEYTAPLFFFLLTGFILAGLILFSEITWHKYRSFKFGRH